MPCLGGIDPVGAFLIFLPNFRGEYINSYLRKENAMNAVFKRFLFERHILVSDGAVEENRFEVLFSLGRLFGIRVTEGEEYVTRDMLLTAGECIGINVPEPFYRGFPESVRELTREQLLFDQLLHYYLTYGMRNFEHPGHSVFEDDFTRLAFNERYTEKAFVCLPIAEAKKYLRTCIDDLLASSRPLSKEQLEILSLYIDEYGFFPETIAAKSTATALLREKRDVRFADFLALSDVIRLVDDINFFEYKNKNVKKLNFKNADRRFVSSVMDRIFDGGFVNVRECFEKKAVWCGLLHHIHYQPKCEAAEKFLYLMRNKGNQSVYSEVEKYLAEHNVKMAVNALKAGKGNGALLRSLDYLISRAQGPEDIHHILRSIDAGRPILLLQLLMHYSAPADDGERVFSFVRHNLVKTHCETKEEAARRKTLLGDRTRAVMAEYIKSILAARLKGRLGRVYVHPAMDKVAIPMHEAATNGGFGTLPSGSRILLDEGQKLRAFTYWEKVDDVDLSMIGIGRAGEEYEFSWRTMYYEQGQTITFSGDETSGYEGGSEYFDIDLERILEERPNIKYIVFCDNVYSGSDFSQSECTAGYMMRDKVCSGEVFEPKTVKTSFRVTADSTYAFLFAVDLDTREFIWLNTSVNSGRIIAANGRVKNALLRIGELDVMSAGELVRFAAIEVVDDPELADVCFTDEELEPKDGREQIHSYEYTRLMSLLG